MKTELQMKNYTKDFEAIYSAVKAEDVKAFALVSNKLMNAIVGNDQADRPDSALLGGPSFPPAMDGATFVSNARAGYGEEGLRGGRIVKDYLLTDRKKRLAGALAVGAAFGVSPDLMEPLFLLGRVTDGLDAADPDDPNPATPSLAPYKWLYLENYRGMNADQFMKNYWAEKNAGSASGGK
jgi:hypothetical protein